MGWLKPPATDKLVTNFAAARAALLGRQNELNAQQRKVHKKLEGVDHVLADDLADNNEYHMNMIKSDAARLRKQATLDKASHKRDYDALEKPLLRITKMLTSDLKL